MDQEWIAGITVAGYGVASGRGNDPRFPNGTLRLQQPFFKARGVDLSSYFSGTLNVDLAPVVATPQRVVFDGTIRWHDDFEERFMLASIDLIVKQTRYSGLWYYPHPSTKPGHFQRESVVELLLPWIDGMAMGERALIRL